MRAAAIAIVFLLAAPAYAIDPECVTPPDPLLTLWPCYDGTCAYCTPVTLTTDASDPTDPARNPTTVSCTTIADGSVLHSVTEAIRGQYVTFAHSVDGELPTVVRCNDGLNDSEVASTARFSAGPRPVPAAPLAPAVLLRE